MAVRTIIFRGKRIDNGQWVEGNLFIPSPTTDGRVQSTEILRGINISRISFAVDPSTVGQYTGKVVKTGKVFDGDIGKSIDGIFLVCWDDEMAAFVMRFNEYPYETLYLEEMWDDAEIIGNIHDNGELMEVR